MNLPHREMSQTHPPCKVKNSIVIGLLSAKTALCPVERRLKGLPLSEEPPSQRTQARQCRGDVQSDQKLSGYRDTVMEGSAEAEILELNLEKELDSPPR